MDPVAPSPPAMSTRTGRTVRLPKRFDDFVPSSRHILPSQYAAVIPPLPPIPERLPSIPASESPSAPSDEEQDEFESTPNAFGVFRRYFREPQQVPDDEGALEDVCDAPGLEGSNATKDSGYESIFWLSRNVAVGVDDQAPDFGPFSNPSQFRLFDYFYDRSEVRSLDAMDDLLHILCSKDFSVDDLKGFSARKGDRALEDWAGQDGSVFSKEDGWRRGSVKIPLPPPKVDREACEATAATFEVTGIIYRSLRPLLEAAVQDTASRFADKHTGSPTKCTGFP
uniref:Transcriptional repressor rco-1 n=1 Tax=Ganoderma boninense TaxID=34458 RepID=A0A5K1K7V5_9APHY|nr:Transcriptional repressor rco-1 [Ganoderma boninense]